MAIEWPSTSNTCRQQVSRKRDRKEGEVRAEGTEERSKHAREHKAIAEEDPTSEEDNLTVP